MAQIKKDTEMRGENRKKYKKIRSGRIEPTEDFSVIVNPHLWKQLKNDDFKLSLYKSLFYTTKFLIYVSKY